MASDDRDYGGIIQLVIFAIIGLFGWIQSVLKKQREQREIADTQAQLRRLDATLAKDRTRRAAQPAPAAPVFQPPVAEAAPAAVEAPSPAEYAVTAPAQLAPHPAEPELEPAARPRRGRGRRAAPQEPRPAEPPPSADWRKALVWREILMPPLALRRDGGA